MMSFLFLKFKKFLILFAVIRTADHFVFTVNPLTSVREIWRKKGGVSTERTHS